MFLTEVAELAPGLDMQPLGHPILTVQTVSNSGIAACLLAVMRRGWPCSGCQLLGKQLCPLNGISVQQEPGIYVPTRLLLFGLQGTCSKQVTHCQWWLLPPGHKCTALSTAVNNLSDWSVQASCHHTHTAALTAPSRMTSVVIIPNAMRAALTDFHDVDLRAYHQGIIQAVIWKEENVNEFSILYISHLGKPQSCQCNHS